MEYDIKPVDRRVIRTKRNIRAAVARLLTEKDINDITISDIAELADINRKTFYNYYSGIHEVLEEIENDVVEKFSAVLDSSVIQQTLKDPYEMFSKLTAVMNTDIDFYSYLFSMDENTRLYAKIIKLIKDKVKKTFTEQLSVNDPAIDIMLDFTVSGMISVYQKWFSEDRPENIEELSENVGIICFYGIDGIMKKIMESEQK